MCMAFKLFPFMGIKQCDDVNILPQLPPQANCIGLLYTDTTKVILYSDVLQCLLYRNQYAYMYIQLQ